MSQYRLLDLDYEGELVQVMIDVHRDNVASDKWGFGIIGAWTVESKPIDITDALAEKVWRKIR